MTETENLPPETESPADTPSESTAAPGESDATPDPTTALNEQIAALQQDLLYARADTQNVRRRADKDVADAHTYAVTKFARDVLSVSDNLSRALAAVPAELREDDRAKGLLTGIEATERELMAVFERHGITRIAAVGLPLDPNHHQAMMEMPDAEAAPGTVVMEMQPGYLIKDRLLRPAMVGVAKKPD